MNAVEESRRSELNQPSNEHILRCSNKHAELVKKFLHFLQTEENLKQHDGKCHRKFRKHFSTCEEDLENPEINQTFGKHGKHGKHCHKHDRRWKMHGKHHQHRHGSFGKHGCFEKHRFGKHRRGHHHGHKRFCHHLSQHENEDVILVSDNECDQDNCRGQLDTSMAQTSKTMERNEIATSKEISGTNNVNQPNVSETEDAQQDLASLVENIDITNSPRLDNA